MFNVFKMQAFGDGMGSSWAPGQAGEAAVRLQRGRTELPILLQEEQGPGPDP